MFRISQWEHENPEYYSQFGLPYHCGLDFPAPNGTLVKSVEDGVVTRLNLNPASNNYGIHVGITHYNGFQTLYCHLQSVNVVMNQVVQCGQVIGLSNNTGNSTGPHLHMEVRNLSQPYTDDNNVLWPYGMRPVWPYIEHLYYPWLQQNGIEGYLYGSSLVKNMSGDYARVVGTLNLRSQPSATSNLLGQVTTGTVVKILSDITNGYYKVLTTNDIPVTPITVTDYGLHMRADPDVPRQAEFLAVQRLIQIGGNTVKLLHNHPVSVFNTIKMYNPKYVMIRIMQSWGNRVVTPQNFYDWNVNDLIQKVQTLGNIPVLVEVHNEPNLYEEGFNYSWNNGGTFAYWLNSVIKMFKSRPELANVKFIFPGLSPGGNIPNVRYDADAFLREALNYGLIVDDFACHAYWSNNPAYPMSTALAYVQSVKNLIGNKKLYVTEASRNDRPSVVPYTQYGTEYADFVRKVNADAVYFFVASASNPYFEPETWVREDGTDKGITNSFLGSL